MHKYEEKTLKTEEIFNGKILHVQVLEVELPDGKTSKREIIKHPGAVCVLAVTNEHKVVMVEQYRKAAERALIEIPAGKLEPGEDPLEAAKRELEEETGYACAKLEPVTAFYTSPALRMNISIFMPEPALKNFPIQKRAMMMNLSIFWNWAWMKSGK